MTTIIHSHHQSKSGKVTASREAPSMTEYLTMEDVRARASELLPAWKKNQIYELRSAIKVFATAARQPASSIHADPQILRVLVAKASPQLVGISKPRWANIRSLIDRALAGIGVLTIRARQRCAVSPVWQELMDRAETLNTKAHLSRFARWCSREGIDAADVDDTTFSTFEDELTEFSLAKNPGSTAAEAGRAWNAAVVQIEGWVGTAVPTRCRRKIVTVPWDALPASFAANVDDYAARRIKPGKFDDVMVRALRPTTVKGHIDNLRRAAGFLIRGGLPADSVTSIKALLTTDNVKKLLDMVWGDADIASPSACQYSHGFVSIARFLEFDDAHLGTLIKFSRRCRRPQIGMTRQNRERLSIFDDEQALLAMYTLPARIADARRKLNDIDYRHAVDMRLAVCVEILLMAPIRRFNLANLDLAKHIVWPTCPDGDIRITIPTPEVKNSVDLHHFLPPESAALVRLYVERFRPLLMKTSTDALFPGDVDGFMTPNSLGRLVRVGLRDHLGIDFNAHLFRHFACMNHLREHPGDYETLRRLCGHKRLDTTVNFYADTETDAAIQRFHDSTVLRIRNRDDGFFSQDMV